jgi:hypothetical protein
MTISSHFDQTKMTQMVAIADSFLLDLADYIIQCALNDRQS